MEGMLFLSLGVLLGGLAGTVFHLVQRQKLEHDGYAKLGELDAKRQQLENSKEQLANLQIERRNLEGELHNLREELGRESKGRSVAEEKSSRLPVLESHLGEKEIQLTQLRDRITELERETVRLRTELEEERKAHDERLETLKQARQEVADSFKALSADALRNNNETFMNLAKSALEKLQQEAKGDLELRQKSIDNVVSPIRESLEKVSHKIESMEKERTSAYAGLTEQVRGLMEGR